MAHLVAGHQHSDVEALLWCERHRLHLAGFAVGWLAPDDWQRGKQYQYGKSVELDTL